MLIAVINTDEQPGEAIEREFPGCEVNVEKETVMINGDRYYYYSVEVLQMPISELTIYELELAGESSTN